MSSTQSPELKNRIRMEQHIVRVAVKSMLDAGYYLSNDLGDGPESKPTNDAAAIEKDLFAGDETRIRVWFSAESVREDVKTPDAWVYMIYGNCGYDVISDYIDCDEIREVLKDAMAIASKFEKGEPVGMATNETHCPTCGRPR